MLEKITQDFGLPAVNVQSSTLAELERRIADYNIMNPGLEVRVTGQFGDAVNLEPVGRAWNKSEDPKQPVLTGEAGDDGTQVGVV